MSLFVNGCCVVVKNSENMAERIRVFVRIRPIIITKDYHSNLSYDTSSDESLDFEYDTEKNEFIMRNKVYSIDGILPPQIQQSDAYQMIATDLINFCLKGFNTTIFAYGQTGSGKTHTIFGPDMCNIMVKFYQHDSITNSTQF